MRSILPCLAERLRARCMADPGGELRVLVVAAHPDDEVVGAASVIQSTSCLFLLHTTDGSPEDLRDAFSAGCRSRLEYADLRRAESARALALAGCSGAVLEHLPFQDQTCSFRLADLAAALTGALARIKPDIIITHPYEGGHPDHDATAFAVHNALGWRGAFENAGPLLLEMTSYHMGPAGITSGEFIYWPGIDEIAVYFTSDELAAKRAMLECFTSQRHTLSYLGCGHERFRAAPVYDFTAPPHPGRLFYEQFAWGLDGAEWRRRAGEALEVLHGGRAFGEFWPVAENDAEGVVSTTCH